MSSRPRIGGVLTGDGEHRSGDARVERVSMGVPAGRLRPSYR
ncbi:hypothetical protein [Nonomuraea cavernae]